MAKSHLDGAVGMLRYNGGPRSVGVGGMIEHFIWRLGDKFDPGYGGQARVEELS